MEDEKKLCSLIPFIEENKLPADGIDGLTAGADEAESEFLCLNKIKLNHFVIISMMKLSEIC